MVSKKRRIKKKAVKKGGLPKSVKKGRLLKSVEKRGLKKGDYSKKGKYMVE